MRILGIETSCDETAIALVDGQGTLEKGLVFEVKKAVLLSQAALHAEYGGVYPTVAKREHEKNLPVLIKEFAEEPADAIAVTTGPGLEPALWTGIEFAKRLAAAKGLPLIPVNHMEGHLISSLAQKEHTNKLKFVSMSLRDVQLPVLALLISGGHTELVLMEGWFSYKVIGKTLDDAVGEAFDKVARMLGLPYPGGPEISKLATQHREAARQAPGRERRTAQTMRASGREPAAPPKLPRPMLQSGTCDFSFSGLKTAALYALRDRGGIQALSPEEVSAFAAELEDAIADVLVAKVRKALQDTQAKTFVIGGGVAANKYIRERLEKFLAQEFDDVEPRLPELSITGDNAVMIAEAALCRALAGRAPGPRELHAVGNLSIAS